MNVNLREQIEQQYIREYKRTDGNINFYTSQDGYDALNKALQEKVNKNFTDK
jgi:hypothetical protein